MKRNRKPKLQPRIRLDEEMFKTLVQHGKLKTEGVTIDYAEMINSGNFNKMIEGKEIEQFGAKMILADIGFDRIRNIMIGG